MSNGKPLVDDEEHARACHDRWMKRINRDMTSPSYQEEWYAEQCLFCRYYIPLVGALAEDWGVCSNPASPMDGRVMFEHDGCEQFTEADEQWTTATDESSEAQQLWEKRLTRIMSEQEGPLPDVRE